MFVLLKGSKERSVTGDIFLNADSVSSFQIVDYLEGKIIVVEMQNGDTHSVAFHTIDEAKEMIQQILRAKEKGVSVHTREGRFIEEMMPVDKHPPVCEHEEHQKKPVEPVSH